MAIPEEEKPEKESGEFGELLKYTLPGYVIGLFAGVLLDRLGLQQSAIGQWIVRTISGESESVFEGVYALRRRMRQAASSMAEAYGWGKLVGMTVPWLVDWGSRLFGIDVYGVEGFYIPYFYALSDQIGANVSGLIFLHRKEESWPNTVKSYFRSPVMLSSLLVVLLVPMGLLATRLLGFSPTTQVFTALETIVANLCWVPPLIGWLAEKSEEAKETQ